MLDTSRYSSAEGLTVSYGERAAAGLEEVAPLVMMDPPEHTEFRALIGRGYTPRALRVFSQWAFDQLKLPRLQLGTLPGNTSSERVAEKVGFSQEGVLRAYLDQRGERRDVLMWSLLPGELG